ncbi:MAG: hypothetical protein AB1454_06480 [Candidatus Auribacterota bacterium]|jgi:hypothetical protein|uniref:Uncharacterized protein n=1 Tax=Candidatus Auribacter fodinae TaxID=2093366 RepID=A0A3A4QX42_9BACT|nr:MAG: hypothetical protein C4541_10200 [Candidatus Auribacter fodinae]
MKARNYNNRFSDEWGDTPPRKTEDGSFPDISSELFAEQLGLTEDEVAAMLAAWTHLGLNSPHVRTTCTERARSDADTYSREQAVWFNMFASVHQSIDLDLASAILDEIGA